MVDLLEYYMKKFLLSFLILSVLLNSCKKEVPAVDTYTAEEQDRDGLYDLMNEWYLWYNLMPTVVKENYKDPYELMDAMRYKTLDKWSFVADYNAFVASMKGTFVGHGIRIGLDGSGKARIVTIYKNSPLYSYGSSNPNGVRRGWIIKTLNGTDLAPIIASGNATAYNNLIGPATAGVINTFVFQTPRGNDTTAITTKSSFQVNSVMLYDTLTLKTGLTGHLVFDEFIEPSSQELLTAFAFFKTQNVKDLILDLRYNNGGILDVATELASYIAGSSKFGTPFIKSSYNDKKVASDSTFKFKSISSPLNLNRLVVITTRETASASEVIINGLKPHLAVTTIGDTTNGKPTGMNVWQTKDYKYIFAPVTFKLVNSAGQGDFYAGFAPAKYVSDDITRDFRDKSELCFKEAIYYLENGTVSSKGAYIYKPSIQYSEKPSWMNNMFVLDKSLINR
jgi:carboxyl-terminal processing protease